MLAKLPVIAPDFAVEVEPVIRETGCGLSINTANPYQLAVALDWYCKNPEIAITMGERGRQAVFDKYNWESEKQKLISIYQGFIK